MECNRWIGANGMRSFWRFDVRWLSLLQAFTASIVQRWGTILRSTSPLTPTKLLSTPAVYPWVHTIRSWRSFDVQWANKNTYSVASSSSLSLQPVVRSFCTFRLDTIHSSRCRNSLASPFVSIESSISFVTHFFSLAFKQRLLQICSASLSVHVYLLPHHPRLMLVFSLTR